MVNEHGSQIKGLGWYFEKEYQIHEADCYILRIVKICRVYYDRSIRKLVAKRIPKGYQYDKTILTLKLGNLLHEIPDTIVRDHYNHIFSLFMKELRRTC